MFSTCFINTGEAPKVDGKTVDFQKSFVGFRMARVGTSSLVVGRFAAKRGSLRSPRGRLVASLGKQELQWIVFKLTLNC